MNQLTNRQADLNQIANNQNGEDRKNENPRNLCMKEHAAVTLKAVDHTNWFACTQLEVTEEQKRVFPVPAVYWLAESAYCGYTPLAIYCGEQLAGLAVYAVDPDDGAYWIMAYMIDYRFQQRGIGRAGMIELIRYMQERYHCGRIKLGHRPENERAARLYASLGFQEAGRDDQEIIRELELNLAN
jgi:diamine N-acetyltransferase